MRYREREGYPPTVCEMNPQQQEALVLAAEAAAAAPKRKRAAKATMAAPAKPAKGARAGIGSSVATGKGQFVVDTSKLRITPNPSLRPNYILVGVEAGEEPTRLPGFGYTEDDVAPHDRAAPATPKKAARKPRAPRLPRRATA